MSTWRGLFVGRKDAKISLAGRLGITEDDPLVMPPRGTALAATKVRVDPAGATGVGVWGPGARGSGGVWGLRIEVSELTLVSIQSGSGP